MAMPTMHDYHGFKITVRQDVTPPVSVFMPHGKRDPAVYRTTSLDLAMRWIDAYRDGQHWAVEAKAS